MVIFTNLFTNKANQYNILDFEYFELVVLMRFDSLS